MGNVNYDVRDQFNQPLLNRAKLIEIIKEEREARERAEGALRRLIEKVPRTYYGWRPETEAELRPLLDEALAALKSSQEEGKL